MKSCSPLSDIFRTVPPRQKVGGSVERHAERSATYGVTPSDEKIFPLSTSPLLASVPSLVWPGGYNVVIAICPGRMLHVEELTTMYETFYRGMDPDEVTSKRVADSYASFVRDEFEWLSEMFLSRRDSLAQMCHELLEAHRALCEAPSDQQARDRWAVADDRYWEIDEELRREEDAAEPYALEADDPRDQGWHEGWVWEFRYTTPQNFLELLVKRREEYEEAKALFENDPDDPELGLAMDRQKTAWEETARLIKLAYEDPESLSKMFESGDSYVDDREVVHPETLSVDKCKACGKYGDTFALIAFEDGTTRDVCVSCEPDFAVEAAQYRPK